MARPQTAVNAAGLQRELPVKFTKRALRRHIRRAYDVVRQRLPSEITDENAVPAYLHGSWLSRHVFWRKLDFVIAGAELQPGMRILDFGCGTGVLLPRLVGQGRCVQATDQHPEIAIELTRQLDLPVEFLPASSWTDHVPDGAMDVIIAANVLEHVSDRRAILTHMRRTLRPGGRLVISGPTENAFYRLGRWMIGFAGDYHVTNVQGVLADALAVGFTEVHRRRYPLPGPGCLYVVAAFVR